MIRAPFVRSPVAVALHFLSLFPLPPSHLPLSSAYTIQYIQTKSRTHTYITFPLYARTFVRLKVSFSFFGRLALVHVWGMSFTVYVVRTAIDSYSISRLHDSHTTKHINVPLYSIQRHVLSTLACLRTTI